MNDSPDTPGTRLVTIPACDPDPGRVEELGGAMVFLASAASDFVNGQVMYVDGGLTSVV